MKLGLKLIAVWMLAVVFGGAAAGVMGTDEAIGTHQQVAFKY